MFIYLFRWSDKSLSQDFLDEGCEDRYLWRAVLTQDKVETSSSSVSPAASSQTGREGDAEDASIVPHVMFIELIYGYEI